MHACMHVIKLISMLLITDTVYCSLSIPCIRAVLSKCKCTSYWCCLTFDVFHCKAQAGLSADHICSLKSIHNTEQQQSQVVKERGAAPSKPQDEELQLPLATQQQGSQLLLCPAVVWKAYHTVCEQTTWVFFGGTVNGYTSCSSVLFLTDMPKWAHTSALMKRISAKRRSKSLTRVCSPLRPWRHSAQSSPSEHRHSGSNWQNLWCEFSQ